MSGAGRLSRARGTGRGVLRLPATGEETARTGAAALSGEAGRWANGGGRLCPPLTVLFLPLPPSQGGGRRHDGSGWAPSRRRRHVFPYRFPGLHGESTVRLSLAPSAPQAGSRDSGALPSGPERNGSPLTCHSRDWVAIESNAYSRPGPLGPGGKPLGYRKGWAIRLGSI